MKENETIPVYTIGIAAKLVGVCPATLRIWERKSIIKPARIGKNRFYSKRDIDRLEHVKCLLQKLRINIAAVKEIFDRDFCWNIRNCSEKVRRTCSIYLHYQKLYESECSK